jgi:uncharacterized protein YegJ (DUF2314 family)
MRQDGADKIVPVPTGDPEMLHAIDQARRSVESFIQAFLNPKPNQKNFLLKVVFEYQDKNEHIWLADLDLTTSPPTGVVANESQIPGLIYMNRIDFSVNDITDWMYLEDGFLVGAFTTRLLQTRERKNLGWKRFLPWRQTV